MNRVAYRRVPKLFLFCIAAAIFAAAIADPIVEFASNAGCFGPGSFTDRSNADVLPALALSAAALALFVLGKARAILDGHALPRRLWTLMAPIFAVQIVALFAMETTEQLVVRGHILGPAMWLGAPVAASLSIHAAFCIGCTWLLARSARRLASTTLRILRIIRAIATLHVAPAIVVRLRTAERVLRNDIRVLCRIGERAPPSMLAIHR